MRSTSPAERGRALARARLADATRRGLRADGTGYPGISRDPISNFWYTDPTGSSGSGVSVTAESALSSGAVFRATEIIANSVAQLPIHHFREAADGEGREPVKDSAVRRLLCVRPNVWQSPFEFRQMLTGHLVLRGNAYAEIVPGASGFADQLVPLNPARVTVEQLESGRLRYRYAPVSGPERQLTQDQVFHLRGISNDGIVGISRITLMRTTVGHAIQSERFAATQFSRRPMMAGVLKHPGRFKDETAAKRIGDSFRALTSGPDGWHGVPVLEQGMEWQSIGMSNADAEFLGQRKYVPQEIGRWMGVPPYLLGDREVGAPADIEQVSLDFLTYSLVAWLEAWEGAIERDLVLDPENECVEHDTKGLLRANTAARFNSYLIATGRRAFMSPNEVRCREGLPPGDDPALDEIREGLGATGIGSTGPDGALKGAGPMTKGKAAPAPEPADAPAPAEGD